MMYVLCFKKNKQENMKREKEKRGKKCSEK